MSELNLTKAQRKRLAKEMRGLAMECLTNGPEMTDRLADLVEP